MAQRPSPSVDQIMKSPIEIQALIAARGFYNLLLHLDLKEDCARTGISIATYIQYMAGVVAALRKFLGALEQAQEAGYEPGPTGHGEIDVMESLKVNVEGNETLLRDALANFVSFVQAHDPEAPGYNPAGCGDAGGPKEENKPTPNIPDALKKYSH